MAETDVSTSEETAPEEGEAAAAEPAVIKVAPSSRRNLLSLAAPAAGALVVGAGGGYFLGRSRGGAAYTGGDSHSVFTYDESATGPDRWGEIDPHNTACSAGNEQSPIDITPRRLQPVPWLSGFQTKYKPTKARVINTGYTFQVNYDPGSRLILQEREYDLLQFHFHTPSEHLVNGKPADMELHLVHRLVGTTSTLAVVGLLISAGSESPLLAKFWERMPPNKETNQGKESATGVTLDVTEVLPANREFWMYGGSLTTPPCSQDVTWILLKEGIQASRAQIAKFSAAYGKNARPVQPLKERFIFEKAPSETA
jgi:carbonic anhydrase